VATIATNGTITHSNPHRPADEVKSRAARVGSIETRI
jgi:hypothetical protein